MIRGDPQLITTFSSLVLELESSIGLLFCVTLWDLALPPGELGFRGDPQSETTKVGVPVVSGKSGWVDFAFISSDASFTLI